MTDDTDPFSLGPCSPAVAKRVARLNQAVAAMSHQIMDGLDANDRLRIALAESLFSVHASAVHAALVWGCTFEEARDRILANFSDCPMR